MYSLRVKGFKTLMEVAVELGELTILMGPPASGKTNLAEALTLLGYMVGEILEKPALKRLSATEQVQPAKPLGMLVRASTCDDVLSRLTGAPRRAWIRFGADGISVDVIGYCSGLDPLALEASLEVKIDDKVYLRVSGSVPLRRDEGLRLPLQLEELATQNRELAVLLNLFAALMQAPKKSREEETKLKVSGWPLGESNIIDVTGGYNGRSLWIPLPRLYGFDRAVAAGFISRGATTARFPFYLLEDASNLGFLLYTRGDVRVRVKELVEGYTNIRVEPLSDGRLAFFDGDREVGYSSVSDTVARLLYTLTALYSNTPYTLQVGFETWEGTLAIRPLIVLEEPEAHVYPLAFTGLKEAVMDSLARGNLVAITTHSGRLAQALWEEADEKGMKAVVYYLYRERGGPTQVYKVSMEALADMIETLEYLTEKPPTASEIKDLEENGVLVKVGRGS